MLYPFVFEPIFKDRIWGGRELDRLYGKPIPEGKPTGESWEISDRPGDTSVIANGPLTGKNLRWLMENHATEILGDAKPATEGRFPLLCKILDAREKLSLQVHPPASKPGSAGIPAGELSKQSPSHAGKDASAPSAEPKTEMWFIANANPDACLYVGLKQGVTRAEFEKKIADGTVADCFHRIPVKAGDTMFLPSGRVHAIGDGLVIFEIQQNSDTTYRVFDWNRIGLNGKPRELHIAESLASIDFNDFEPKLVPAFYRQAPNFKFRQLVEDPLFNVQEMVFENAGSMRPAGQYLRVIAVVKGAATISDRDSGISVELKPGQFGLIPACLKGVEIKARPQTTFLCVEAN